MYCIVCTVLFLIWTFESVINFIIIAGERIAVEYLLVQSNRGDLLSEQMAIGDILPEILDEDLDDECPDLTVPQAHDLTLQVILGQEYTGIKKFWKNNKQFIFNVEETQQTFKRLFFLIYSLYIHLLITSAIWKRWRQACVRSQVSIGGERCLCWACLLPI